ncbi:MAG: thiamine pyrophosphate-binding protein [Parabacteroides sp.]|nr:thiamine pyrophosphate-binding protein [Parabacteroides sp.]
MEKYYTKERNAQIVLALLKAHGIRKIVASPGTTNIAIVGSVQNDPFFEVYSSVDERSAAYLACGLAAESNEPVVLTCTGATASRNYMSGLTEAYYRKLPIIALTSAQNTCRSGHLYPQFVDRTEQPKDIVKCSVQLPVISTSEDEWDCIVKTNYALLELKRHGGGPVHINLVTGGELTDFSVKELPKVRIINRIISKKDFPVLPSGKIALFIGSHLPFSEEQTKVIDDFCASNNAVAFCDHTSGYKGKYRVLYSLVASQSIKDENIAPDLLIHIGEISGDYLTTAKIRSAKEVWRISEDGEIRDYFHKLKYIFEMSEFEFFSYYTNKEIKENKDDYLISCKELYLRIHASLPELPFSNIWMASQLATQLPEDTTLHLGILNSLRAWNFFEIPNSVTSFCNVGGFGIDGGVSAMIGASLCNPSKLYFGVFGDLAFFYDMNVLGNRHIGRNLRILLVNNGKGTEFRNYTHPGSKFGDDADKYIAAGGHFGNKSSLLVKHYAENLGFEYITASNKEEFNALYKGFINPSIGDHSIIFEVFTTNEDESEALKLINNIEVDQFVKIKSELKSFVRNNISNDLIQTVKKVIK